MAKVENLVNQFKKYVQEHSDIEIDFKEQAYTPNNKCYFPQFDFSLAIAIIKDLFDWAEIYRKQNLDKYPHFAGLNPNMDQVLDKLQHKTLESIIFDVCDVLINNEV